MNWKCIFGWHECEIIEQYDYCDTRGNIIGKVYVTKCKYCGHIKTKTVKTVSIYD